MLVSKHRMVTTHMTVRVLLAAIAITLCVGTHSGIGSEPGVDLSKLAWVNANYEAVLDAVLERQTPAQAGPGTVAVRIVVKILPSGMRTEDREFYAVIDTQYDRSGVITSLELPAGIRTQMAAAFRADGTPPTTDEIASQMKVSRSERRLRSNDPLSKHIAHGILGREGQGTKSATLQAEVAPWHR